MSAHTIRALAESKETSFQITDAITAKPLFWWRGNSVRFESALADNGQFLTASDVGSITVIIKPVAAAADDPGNMIKVISAGDCDGAFDGSQWSDGSGQLFVAEWTKEEAALDAGEYVIIISHDDPAGKRNTYLHSRIAVKEDQHDSVSITAPPTPPTNYYTQAEADARFAPLGVGLVLSVKDPAFGAVGDDATDDRAAIQAAIDYVSTNGGGTVFFPDGTYRVSKGPSSPKQSISLASNVSIIGNSREGTIIKLLDSVAADTPVMAADNGGTAENISICNLTIDGNRTRHVTEPTAAEDEGINIKTGRNILIHNVRVTQCAMDPVDFDAGDRIIVNNCYIDNNGGSFHLAGGGTSYVMISNSYFLNNGTNRINGSGDVALSAGNIDLRSSSYVTISNCISVGGPRPLSVYGGLRTMVSNCIFNGSTGYPAVDLRGRTTTPSGEAIFSNCRFNASGTDECIVVNESFDLVKISHCDFAGHTGIKVNDGDGLEVESSRFNCASQQILLYETNGNPVIVRNNWFLSTMNGNACRVETNCRGVFEGNRLEKSGESNTALFLHTAVDSPWVIRNNYCNTSCTLVYVLSGGTGAHIIENNHHPSGRLYLQGTAATQVRNNKVGKIQFNLSSTANIRLEANEFTGSIVTGSSLMHNQVWKENYGTGAYAESGTVTLVGGSATVNSSIIPANAKISLTRQATGGSLGHLSIGAITAGTSFVINSSSGSETSTIFWSIDS